MLDPATWLENAQSLPLGGRRRFNHDCGGGRTLIAAHTDEGWNAYCWRCSDKGFHGAPRPSLSERIAKLKAVQSAEAEVEADVRPPMPANFIPSTWPLEARVWLYKAGYSNEQIQAHGFYYAVRLGRVVLPVVERDTGTLVYWQARGFDKGRPKYLNPPTDKSRLIARYGIEGPVVLTEDILSAGRVGTVAQGWSLLGTAISDTQVRMVSGHGPVAVWLDDDGPGRRASAKIVRRLLNFGVEARAIHTPLDPKCYSNEEIATFLLN